MNQLHSYCGVVYGLIKAMQISTSTLSLKEYIFFQFGHAANSDFEYFNCLSFYLSVWFIDEKRCHLFFRCWKRIFKETFQGMFGMIEAYITGEILETSISLSDVDKIVEEV